LERQPPTLHRRPARPVAHPVQVPDEVPGRHPHARAGPPGRDRRRPPRSAAHRHRAELVRGLHARCAQWPGHHCHQWRTAHAPWADGLTDRPHWPIAQPGSPGSARNAAGSLAPRS